MPDKRKPAWLYGCGIGCGVLVLAAAVLIGAGAWLARRTSEGFEQSVEARRVLEERFGEPADFTPQGDGSIAASRVEAFLKIRDAMTPHREALVDTFRRLPMSRMDAEEIEKKSFLGKLAFALTIGKEALGLGREVGDFLRARDQAMLEAGMGAGEYEYLYTVSYYTWLGHAPSDGPRTDLHENAEGGHNEFQGMGPRVMSRIHGELTQMLRRQLASLPPTTQKSWLNALDAEIQAMENDDDRIPWQGRVPEVIVASLMPYRQRLEGTYSRATNPFEMARSSKRGRWSYRTD